METFAWVTAILTLGPEWFRNMGTDLSAGPRVFSIAGDCAQPGVYEFPLGITVEQSLETVGGINAQAVHIGGDCGTFVSVAEFGRRIAYEDLPPGGAITIVGPQRNRLRVTRNLLQYYVQESCGQCAPCREGIPLLLAGVCNLLRGSRPKTTLIELRALAESVLLSSKCRLGKSAANVFLSAVHPGDAHDLAR